jgi:Ser/Thr protein kinase RdoA (MazF antagonist)
LPAWPRAILDAVESMGFRCSGALQALNSYENRVWQIGIDEGPPLVAKFYRPDAGAMRRSPRSTPSPPKWRPRNCRW